jgi:hypothetical protein
MMRTGACGRWNSFPRRCAALHFRVLVYRDFSRFYCSRYQPQYPQFSTSEPLAVNHFPAALDSKFQPCSAHSWTPKHATNIGLLRQGSVVSSLAPCNAPAMPDHRFLSFPFVIPLSSTFHRFYHLHITPLSPHLLAAHHMASQSHAGSLSIAEPDPQDSHFRSFGSIT